MTGNAALMQNNLIFGNTVDMIGKMIFFRVSDNETCEGKILDKFFVDDAYWYVIREIPTGNFHVFTASSFIGYSDNMNE